MENFKANENQTILKNECCDISLMKFLWKRIFDIKKWKKIGFCD
jgi:hypothetical protein